MIMIGFWQSTKWEVGRKVWHMYDTSENYCQLLYIFVTYWINDFTILFETSHNSNPHLLYFITFTSFDWVLGVSKEFNGKIYYIYEVCPIMLHKNDYLYSHRQIPLRIKSKEEQLYMNYKEPLNKAISQLHRLKLGSSCFELEQGLIHHEMDNPNPKMMEQTKNYMYTKCAKDLNWVVLYPSLNMENRRS